MRRRVIVALLAVTSLAIPSLAAARGVTVTSKHTTGGFAAVSSCGSLAGIGVAWLSTANAVTSVTLSSIPAGCVGGILSITLASSSNTSLGSVAATSVTATSQTLSVSGSPTATSVAKVFVAVSGP
ncbi:MAG TPA: hypothetical protein VG650_01385 [Mycobacteriales bacterium]|nr:hypothetical protein [Mycobacteriales bacterium]